MPLESTEAPADTLGCRPDIRASYWLASLTPRFERHFSVCANCASAIAARSIQTLASILTLLTVSLQPPTCTCSDVPPDNVYSCAQQQAWGKCCLSWMLATNSTFPQGFCQTTCGRCGHVFHLSSLYILHFNWPLVLPFVCGASLLRVHANGHLQRF